MQNPFRPPRRDNQSARFLLDLLRKGGDCSYYLKRLRLAESGIATVYSTEYRFYDNGTLVTFND